MRRAIAALLALTLLAAAGLVCAHWTVNGTRESVEMHERVLYGDGSAAEGMRLHVPVYSGGHLFWDTELETGVSGTAETDFRFLSERWYGGEQRGRVHNGLYASLMTNMGAGGNFGTEFDFESEYYGGYEDYFYVVYGDILRAVASRTEPAQEHTERVELTDWIDFVPVQFDVGLPGYIYKYDGGENCVELSRGDPGELGAMLAERFHIPLEGSCPVDISVSKNTAGEIVEWQISQASDEGFEGDNAEAAYTDSWSGLNVNTWSFVTEDACWFVFDQWQSDRELGRIDFSALPGGRGVYRLPFEYEGEDSQVTRVYLDDMKTVLPVAESENIEMFDTDGEHLLMFTSDGEALYLTQALLEEPEKAVRARLLELEELPEEYDMYDGIDRAALGQGLYCVWTTGGRLLLLEADAGGEYEMCLNVRAYPEGVDTGMTWGIPQDWNISLGYDNLCTAMLWNGERLAVARWYMNDVKGDYGAVSGPLLWVYDGTGLLYAGCFESSLTLPPTELYNNVIRASGDLELEWK